MKAACECATLYTNTLHSVALFGWEALLGELERLKRAASSIRV